MKERFKELSEKYPNLSSAMIYSKLVRGRKMSQREVTKWFNKLVDKDDYLNMEKRGLTYFYYKLSNG